MSIRSFSVFTSLYVVLFSACALNRSDGAERATSWTDGTYRLSARISYRDDQGGNQSMGRLQVTSTVLVGPNGPTSATSSVGPCVGGLVDKFESAYQCGEAILLIEPSASGLRADIVMTVTETFHLPRCVAYSQIPGGGEVCTQSTYDIETHHTQKRSRAFATKVR